MHVAGSKVAVVEALRRIGPASAHGLAGRPSTHVAGSTHPVSSILAMTEARRRIQLVDGKGVCREEARFSQFLRSKTMADRGHRRRRRPHQAAPVGDAHQDEPKLAVRDPRNVPEAEYARSVLQPNTNQDPSIMTWMDEDRNNKKDLKRSGRVSKKELNSFEVPTNLAGQRRELQSIYKGICTNVNTNTMLRRRYLKLALKIKDEELSRSKDALQLLEWIEESMEEISRLQAQVRDLHGPPYDLPKVLSCELKLKEKKKKKKKGHSK